MRSWPVPGKIFLFLYGAKLPSWSRGRPTDQPTDSINIIITRGISLSSRLFSRLREPPLLSSPLFSSPPSSLRGFLGALACERASERTKKVMVIARYIIKRQGGRQRGPEAHEALCCVTLFRDYLFSSTLRNSTVHPALVDFSSHFPRALSRISNRSIEWCIRMAISAN